jgi:molybdate transport system substrate-binding protein
MQLPSGEETMEPNEQLRYTTATLSSAGGSCRVPSTLVLAVALMLTGCGGGERRDPAPKRAAQPTREVTIAAASDLKFALDEVVTELERQQPEIRCRVTYGSSGNFFAQLSNRAPFDLYLSADIDYPRKLIEQGLAIRGTEFQYAVGHLVVWVPHDSPLNVEETGIQTLLDPAVRRIAIANPRHAPYGRAAEAALKSLGVYDQVQNRLVLAENIAQTAQFVETGAADIGLISLSLASAPFLSGKGKYWPVPESAHPPLEQGGVILTWAKDRDAAEQVRSYLISDPGRAILKKYGFAEPRPGN